jgi:DNA-binding LytR/AlgR family response regulator
VAFREEIAIVRERRPKAVRASWTAADWARGAAVATSVGLFMSVVRAFGTGELPPGRRALFWIAPMLAGTALARATYFGMGQIPWLKTRRTAQLGVGTVLMAALYTPLVVWWVHWPWADAPIRIDLAATFPMVLMISAVMTLLNVLVERRHAQWPTAAAEKPPEVRFLKRLPPALRGAELYALEAEDHYLRLHTSRGTDLVLCRMADAVAELHGMEGFRTHRSWWVARAAVAKAVKADGRAVLTLKSGVEAPVSRTALPALRQAGWV